MNTVSKAEPPSGGIARWLHISFTMATFVTGVVDAVSYLALGHVFSANMTGNIVLLGFAAAHAPNLSMTRSAIALFAALIGGLYAGRLEKVFRPLSRRRWIVSAAASECVLLCAATGLALHCQHSGDLPFGEEFGLIALTALAMGIRNSTVRHMGAADFTTTQIQRLGVLPSSFRDCHQWILHTTAFPVRLQVMGAGASFIPLTIPTAQTTRGQGFSKVFRYRWMTFAKLHRKTLRGF